MRHVLNAVIAALVLAYVAVPSTASAQCAFEHPKKAKKFQTSLVQAFHGCSLGFNSCCAPANTTTEGGVPACKPPEAAKGCGCAVGVPVLAGAPVPVIAAMAARKVMASLAASAFLR